MNDQETRRKKLLEMRQRRKQFFQQEKEKEMNKTESEFKITDTNFKIFDENEIRRAQELEITKKNDNDDINVNDQNIIKKDLQHEVDNTENSRNTNKDNSAQITNQSIPIEIKKKQIFGDDEIEKAKQLPKLEEEEHEDTKQPNVIFTEDEIREKQNISKGVFTKLQNLEQINNGPVLFADDERSPFIQHKTPNISHHSQISSMKQMTQEEKRNQFESQLRKKQSAKISRIYTKIVYIFIGLLSFILSFYQIRYGYVIVNVSLFFLKYFVPFIQKTRQIKPMKGSSFNSLSILISLTKILSDFYKKGKYYVIIMIFGSLLSSFRMFIINLK